MYSYVMCVTQERMRKNVDLLVSLEDIGSCELLVLLVLQTALE